MWVVCYLIKLFFINKPICMHERVLNYRMGYSDKEGKGRKKNVVMIIVVDIA